ncbi:TIGR03085 family metal-binding protein [Ornithinimicrobium sp. Y1847]|uniref:TIGR03085 family metal-binding protein n=1 Tax=unclassified Ornithinimicrobium TaxID=2615080 RepID=UPI003B66EB5E
MSTAHLRELVATTALRLGPQAPTLCHPWTVHDLLAHLVLRETRPDALPGIGLPLGPLERHTERLQDELAREHSLAGLADRVRTGPPSWSPTRLGPVDRAVNTAELAVHLEDMVRAQPGDPEPTVLDAETQQQLWDTVRRAGRLLYRSAPVGVVLVAPGYGRAGVKRPPSGDVGSVVLTGEPLELLLHAFGRAPVAQLRAEGSDADVLALEQHERSA